MDQQIDQITMPHCFQSLMEYPSSNQLTLQKLHPLRTLSAFNILIRLIEQASESRVEGEVNFDFQRTVRAQSIVIGKKVQNSTSINLLDIDSSAACQDKQFPVKVIYVKPSHAYHNVKRDGKQDEQSENKENNTSKINQQNVYDNMKTLKMKKDFPKTNAISDQQKLKEVKHRPKSATTQQINKNSIQRSKLGANSDIKPQISYVQKVAKSQQSRPQTAKPQLQVKKRASQLEEVLSPKKETEIPFAQNRFQGQFGNLTKDLFKKAQDALMSEKHQQQKLKDEMKQNKEKLRLMTEDHKKMNQELVIKQKEKGVERIDFRKKEEEKKDKLRNLENNLERQKIRETREKRKQDNRKQLGLEMFNEDKVEEYRNKVKLEIQEKEQQQQQVTQNSVKLMQPRQASQDNHNVIKRQMIQASAAGRPHSAFNNRDMKDLLKENKNIELEEEKKEKERDKKEILKEMKLKRKVQEMEKKKQEEDEQMKKVENMKILEETLRQQKEEYYKKKELHAKMREEQKRIEKEMEEQEKLHSKKNKKKKKTIASNHKEQLDDLRNWIEEQMMKEDLKVNSEGELNGEEEDNDNMNHSFKNIQQPQIKVKIDRREDASQDSINVNQMKLLKHMLPGNHLLSEKEEAKLGGRQNRYGVAGDNGYGKVVEIQRQKMIVGEDNKHNKSNSSQNQSKSQQQSGKKLSKEETKKVKDHLVSKVKEMYTKVGLTVYQRDQDEEISDVNGESQSENANEYDMQPMRELQVPEPSRKVIIVKANKDSIKKDAKESKEKKLINQDIPGVLNIEKELRRQQIEKEEKEEKATVVLQKWTRGFLARHGVRQTRESKRREIEEEYSYFDDQVKFNADYNLQKFLKDKQTLREKNKTVGLGESSDIQEKIGESSSMNLQQQQRSSSSQQQRGATEGGFAMLQNFFKQPSDKDPLSLISIFAKRNAPPPVIADDSQPVHNRKSSIKKGKVHTDSEIEESIYSENFEHDSKVSVQNDDEIDEDIIESKGLSSSSNIPQQVKQQSRAKASGTFSYKPQSSIAESIQDDYALMSADRRSKRSPGAESSIGEESHLQSASKVSGSFKKRQSSIIEESIEGDYEEEKFDSYQESRNLNPKQAKQHKKMVSDFQEKLKQDETKRKTYVNEFLNELNRYEQAYISSSMVERVEKIISQSLAQKDKLILGQRLHELEADKRHKDEINKIREEQIKLMSQMILLGGANGAQGNMSDEDKQKLFENIQKIIEKPIIIQRKEEGSEEGIYEEKESVDYIEESRTLKNQQKLGGGGATIEEEDSIQESINEISEDLPDEAASEENKEEQSQEDDIKESVYVDGKKQVENGLSMARITLGSEEAVRLQARKTLEGENKKQDKNGTFEKSSFQDFTHSQFKKMMFFDPSSMSDYMGQIENAIIDKSEKEQKKLKQDYHKQLISPRTYSKKQKDIEKWVTNERKELQSKKQKMMQSAEEIGEFLNKLGDEKKIMLGKIGSPRTGKRVLDMSSQGSIEYDDIEEESNDSIRVRAARNQLRNVQRNLQYDQEDKDLAKKKATAKKLLQEKEKAIQEGIKKKMKNIESEYVDELLNEALNIDIDKEIDKRIRGARQVYEESRDTWTDAQADSVSARSVVEQQNDKKKKKVNFASPPSTSKDRFSSVHSYNESIESSKGKTSSHKFEESIGESIKIEDSYQVSQPSVQESNKNSKSAETTSNNNNQQQQYQSSMKESIKESEIEESVNSDQYSEDFASQSQVSDRSNKQFIQSRNKLQNKAETIEEHNDIGYSMNFDEDSMGQSQNFNSGTQNLKNQQQIEQVQEKVEEESEEDESVQPLAQSMKESIRESFNDIQEIEDSQNNYTDSKGLSSQQQVEVQSQSESEDREVLYSAKSVEWQINLEQMESNRLKQQLTEGSIDEYSENFEDEPMKSQRQQEVKDENEESDQEDQQEQEAIDDLNDLESFPDDIEDSFNDFQNKADMITDELLELVLQEFKNDQEFQTQQQHVDEEQFFNKFPYTEDNVPAPQPVEEEQRPQSSLLQIDVSVNNNNRETQEEQQKQKYEEQQREIMENMEKVNRYLAFLIESVNKKDLISTLEKPIEVDPLKILARIQAFENDDSQSFNNLNETQHTQAVLPLEFFIDSEKDFKLQNGDIDLTESQNQRYELNDHKAIFDALNDALDQERPYKQKGMPAPWSKQTRFINPKITVPMVEKMLKKAKDKVMIWAKTGAGTKYAPMPPPPPPAQNEFDQPQQQNLQSDEERRNGLREERLGELLTKEIEENDVNWVDYEIEDAQVKFDLADMVLEHLAGEVAEMLLSRAK